MLFLVIPAIIAIAFTAGYSFGKWDAGQPPRFFPSTVPKWMAYRPLWWTRIFD